MDVGLVCDCCGAFNALGVNTCTSCTAGLSLDTRDLAPGSNSAPLEDAPFGENTQAYGGPEDEDFDDDDDDFNNDDPTDAGSAAKVQICATCDAEITGSNRFCGACGTPVGAPTAPAAGPQAAPTSGGTGKKTLFFSSIQAAKAKLVLIKGEGNDGESYSLAGEDHHIGRSDADIIFEEDEFLSPTHANFFYQNGKLVVQDENSTNGVYLRIRNACPLKHDDYFLVGEQVIHVRRHAADPGLKATEDGTYLYASPRRACNFEVIQVLQGGAEGIKFLSSNDTVTLGREENDINFPDDPFISGHHAQVSFEDDALTLTDTGSKNGTFVRITEDTPLAHGDYVFMGQQLLRVEIV